MIPTRSNALSLSLFYDSFESHKEAVTDRRIEPRRINIEENMPKKCKQLEGEEQGWFEPRLFQAPPGLLFSVFIGPTNTSVKKVDEFFTRVIIGEKKKK